MQRVCQGGLASAVPIKLRVYWGGILTAICNENTKRQKTRGGASLPHSDKLSALHNALPLRRYTFGFIHSLTQSAADSKKYQQRIRALHIILALLGSMRQLPHFIFCLATVSDGESFRFEPHRMATMRKVAGVTDSHSHAQAPVSQSLTIDMSQLSYLYLHRPAVGRER